jgi:DNA-binding CsgD family transcriptional regulator/tetratricopeptide (TPR) repeat protein
MEARASQIFVGRARELGTLERLLEQARTGNGAAALIAGEAGIGKTRLASELGRRGRDAGFTTLVGRSIDLVGTELPYQPFVDALRSLGGLQVLAGRKTGSQVRVFEETLALLTERAAVAPVLLVLEDLHWADTSTLDLVAYLAHNVDDRPVLLAGTLRADEPSSAERMRRLVDAVRRSGSGTMLEIDPLDDEEVVALLDAHAELPPPVTDAIVARSEGNPFFAEELLAAARRGAGDLPRGLRDLLLQRSSCLDPGTQNVLRVAAAAGRDVTYELLAAVAALPEREVRESLRQAVDHGVLVVVEEAGSFRFRHALLAEAIYATVLPGEREELHGRLAEGLARSGAAVPAELAPHWAAAGRAAEALAASVEAAREAEALFGLAEAHAHLERALVLWDVVPEAAELVKLELAELCFWTAELASSTGSAPRAVELQRRAIDLVGEGDRPRAALLYARLSRYLYECGKDDAGLAALGHAVELVPAQPPSAERAEVLSRLGGGLRLAWRFEESLAVCQEALAVARVVGAHQAEFRALDVLGSDLVYLGRAEEGLTHLRRVLELAEESGDPLELRVAYVGLTDVYTMLGRPREAARLGAAGLEAMRGSGVENTVLEANYIEALLAIGEWDLADDASAIALRAVTANYPYMLLCIRAYLEIGRGRFDEARAHLDAAQETLRPDRALGIYDVLLAELALWERRWTEADQAVQDALAGASSRQAAQLRVWFCAEGLRAQAELAALARARRDSDARAGWLDRSERLITIARVAAAEAAAITPNAAGWLALAEAEYERARGAAPTELWSEAARTWERLERPPLAAYCRWRQAEALVGAGAPRTEAGVPLRDAHAVAARLGAKPLLRELELLAERARLDLAPPDASPTEGESLEKALGLTPREAEVLSLVARGYTNREIAAALVISVRTASVHVSHILRKLDARNRLEAAAIMHRLAPPRVEPPGFDADIAHS